MTTLTVVIPATDGPTTLERAVCAIRTELATAAERALEANWRLLDGVERATE